MRPPIAQLKAIDPTVDCKPEAIPNIAEDRNLGTIDPITGLAPSGFRRGVGERAGPPYIGRGLMEAVPTQDIVNAADPSDTRSGNSSLKTAKYQCTGDCVTGAVNTIPSNVVASSSSDSTTEPPPPNAKAAGVGRFGLRANGVELMQFIIGGLQGELSLRSLLNNTELNIADGNIAPYNRNCRNLVVTGDPSTPEFRLSTPFSERNFLRLTAPPEFGPNLLAVLNSKDPSKPINDRSRVARVQRGAQLFGIDLTAFANRMIPGRIPSSGDGRDPNAINQNDQLVGCVTCHIPVQRTGRSPAFNDPSLGTDVAAVTDVLSYRWAPIFSDLILHSGPTIDAERVAPTPRDPILVSRSSKHSRQDNYAGEGKIFNTYDLTRNLTDDIFSNQKATAKGEQFRTPPLMGIGKIGPPFLHDGRVYLSTFSRDTTPAGTVFTNSEVTNAPLVVRSIDDALHAAIELHDLPAPDDNKTSKLPGGGCPVPPGGKVVNKIGNVIDYGSSPKDVICPPYDSPLSTTRRSEAREVIARFRSLTPSDQQAMIDFLKEL
jgi:hypothetical protein